MSRCHYDDGSQHKEFSAPRIRSDQINALRNDVCVCVCGCEAIGL